MKLGTYRYTHAVSKYPVPDLQRFTLRVEILEEKGERLRVRFMAYHADGRGPNCESWVMKKNVRPDEETRAVAYSGPARLPYKDD